MTDARIKSFAASKIWFYKHKSIMQLGRCSFFFSLTFLKDDLTYLESYKQRVGVFNVWNIYVYY